MLGEYRHQANGWLAERLPLETMLPVARDGGGDILFLDLAPATYGQVVGYVHGLPEWTGQRGEATVAVLAVDFAAYLDKVFIAPDTAEMNWATRAALIHPIRGG
ncbi:SMI1/KNR4 family protein [Streptosporangium canum]|uniref:SMI1/KNR4 family protein n=1 Tax=Streptosporangium canum TaxID=324952 RepID=UPI0036C3E41B